MIHVVGQAGSRFHGNLARTTAIGQKPGAGFPAEEVVGAIDRLIDAYLELRSSPEERFIDAFGEHVLPQLDPTAPGPATTGRPAVEREEARR